MNFTLVFGIVAAYFALILGVIVYARYAREGKIMPGLSEYLLASRNVPTLVLILTYVSSLFSTAAVIAYPSFVFQHGIGGVMFAFLGDSIGIIFMLLFYNHLRKYALEHDLYSPVECLSHAYQNRFLGVMIAGLTIIFLIPYISLQLVAMGRFLEGLSDGQIGYLGGVGFMMAVVMVYVLIGGMRAVAFTDAVQGLAILIGFSGGLLFLAYHYWDGPAHMWQDVTSRRPEHMSLPGPQGQFTPLYFMTSTVMLIGLFFQPQLLTRGLMARDRKQINAMAAGLFLSILIYTPMTILYALGASVIFGQEVEANAIVGKMFAEMAGINLIGVILCALFLVGAIGASMSTADSMLLTIGQMTSRDVIRPFRDINRKRQLFVSKLVMGLTMLGAFIFGLNPPAVMIDLALMSIAAACAIVPTYLGFQWRYKSTVAAYLSVITGTIILMGIEFFGWPAYGMHEGFVTLLVSSLVYVSGCFISRRCSMESPS